MINSLRFCFKVSTSIGLLVLFLPGARAAESSRIQPMRQLSPHSFDAAKRAQLEARLKPARSQVLEKLNLEDIKNLEDEKVVEWLVCGYAEGGQGVIRSTGKIGGCLTLSGGEFRYLWGVGLRDGPVASANVILAVHPRLTEEKPIRSYAYAEMAFSSRIAVLGGFLGTEFGWGSDNFWTWLLGQEESLRWDSLTWFGVTWGFDTGPGAGTVFIGTFWPDDAQVSALLQSQK